ncbi:hypothetical protein GCM10023334_009130 [Nonomuraea thailandensis]
MPGGGADTYRDVIVLWLAAITSCGTPAGIHNARVVGSTHVLASAATVSVPLEAHASWCTSCVCRAKRVRAGIANLPMSTSAMPCPFSDMMWKPTSFRTSLAGA